MGNTGGKRILAAGDLSKLSDPDPVQPLPAQERGATMQFICAIPTWTRGGHGKRLKECATIFGTFEELFAHVNGKHSFRNTRGWITVYCEDGKNA